MTMCGPTNRLAQHLTCLAVVLAAMSSGCDVPEAIFCVDEPVDTASLIVTDADTTERICDATIEIRNGEYEETVPAADLPPEQCLYHTSSFREGTYDVTVSRDGYATQTFEDQRVFSSGRCHREGIKLKVALEPE